MSGEYYNTNANPNSYYASFDRAPAGRKSPVQGHKLHDIEEQLEMAESKCNNLKDQLDHMKEVYGLKKQSGRSRKFSSITPNSKCSDGEMTSSSVSGTSTDGRYYLKKQNSNAIETDNTGAAVRTINNILNGITDSVNRLSVLHVQIAETPGRDSFGTNTPLPVVEVIANPTEAQTHSQIEVEIQPATDSNIKISTKSKNIRKKAKETKPLNKKTASHQSIKRNTRSEMKRCKATSTRTSVLEKEPPKLSRENRPRSPKPKTRSTNLVEIYHNIAAKNSDSDEGQLNKSKKISKRSEEIQVDTTEIPPLNIPEKETQHGHTQRDIICSMRCDKITQNEFPYEVMEPPRTVSCFSKNYELPTIASRMKQAAKYYLNTFNFKAIPFCAAISTSPSHNIGINIQQVMNIIKNRQPINGISPTLAHNIGLAADRLNTKPISALVSTITSKTCYKPSRCPLSKTLLNFEQLQSLAKSIPEETAQELEDYVESPEIETVIITGPSGDMELSTKKTPVWAMESVPSEQCTCVTQSGINFQQIMNKYKKPGSMIMANTAVNKKNIWQHRYPHTNTKKAQKKSEPKETNGDTESHPLHGKEKNLKDVLMNLHNEFEHLNKKYEDLCQKTTTDDEETLKELELIENELNKKEEEITMVMTLYKEVLALKQQVKSLKQKASLGSVTAAEIKETTSTTFSHYNNPQAALHLTKLLRQIQMYQMRYKKGNAV